MPEQYGFWLVVVGLLLAAAGWLWLLVAAFRQRWYWGLGILLLPPVALLFIAEHFRRAARPLLLLLTAGVVLAVPYGLNYYQRHFVPLRPYEQRVDGELRITVTGLQGFDYATLADRPDTAVLQMANADVDDRTLEHLRGMGRLRKLDVSNSRVTDEGLRTLAGLPALEEVYLAHTAITDDGFQKILAPKESIRRLDLTGTEVKGKTKRAWKNARPDDREYVD